jgi:hypothetical protein
MLARFVYFAISIFWRAAAHEWPAILGQRPVRLTLGPYEERLRQFLLGEATFPNDVVLLVRVSSTDEEGSNEHVVFPFLKNNKSGSKQYMFCVPGVVSQLFVGKATPATLRKGCTARSLKSLIYLGSNDFTIDGMGRLLSKAAPKGDLA